MGKRAYYEVPVLGTGAPMDTMKGDPGDPFRPDVPDYGAGACVSVLKHDTIAGKMIVCVSTSGNHSTPPNATKTYTADELDAVSIDSDSTLTKSDGSDVYGNVK